jgi:hypothetical protein
VLSTAAASSSKYRQVFETSLRIGWRLEEVLPEQARLDLARPFLPDALAGVEQLQFLSRDERRTLNHLRGHSYLRMFGLVEQAIVPFVVDHARARCNAGDYELRALLQFASEEVKHIQLFERFSERFEQDIGLSCASIGPADSLAEAVLAHHPLGVALMILHIEWMSQKHYTDAVRDRSGIDPLVHSLLKHHWLEESQHAQLDGLIVQTLAERASPAERRRGVEDYQRIVALLDHGSQQQVELDLETFQSAIGRQLSAQERDAVREAQRAALHYTFIECGAEHPRFVEIYRALADG